MNHDMIDGAVLADMIAQRHVRMCHCNPLESGIADLAGSPVQKRKIHHTVDNRPALCKIHIPCPDKSSVNIITGGQRGRHKKVDVFGAGISGQPRMSAVYDVRHKSDIVIQIFIFFKAAIDVRR